MFKNFRKNISIKMDQSLKIKMLYKVLSSMKNNKIKIKIYMIVLKNGE